MTRLCPTLPGDRRPSQLSNFCRFFLLLCLSVAMLPAQLNRGAIEGLVTDPQGSAAAGVAVTITSVERKTVVPIRTNDAGYYRVEDLVPGTYVIHFELSGFTSEDVNNIEVGAGRLVRVDTRLKIGTTQQTVEVTAQAPLLDTAAGNFTTTIETRAIQEIPVQGRDLMQLVYMFPGVNSNTGPPGTNFGFNSQFGTFPDPTNVLGSNLSVNGGQGGANAWYLDGNLNLSTYNENAVISPSPDAVTEFQMVRDGFAAEYGRTGGGVFSVVLKSGTNTFHGSGYEYLRNSATNARNPFTSIDGLGNIIPDRVLHYNDFGGTFGGPVLIPKIYNGKNRTFFFTSLDKHILHLFGEQVYTVPTAEMRQGNFSEVAGISQYGLWDPFSTIGPDANGIFARSAFGTAITPNGCTGSIVGGVAMNPTSATCQFATSIPKNRLDPTAQYFLNSYPMPNYNSPLGGCPMGNNGFPICNNFLGSVGTAQDPYNTSVKIDHQFSEKNHFFLDWLYNTGAYSNYRVPWTGPSYPVGSVGFGSEPPVAFHNQVAAIGNTYSITPSLINEFRYAFSRQFFGSRQYLSNGPYSSLVDLPAVKKVLDPLQFYTTPAYPIPQLAVNLPDGSLNLGVPEWDGIDAAGLSHTFLDNITKIVGKHTLRAGVTYRKDYGTWDTDGFTSMRFYGSLNENPSTGQGAGSGLEQFLLGAPQPNQGFVVQNIPAYEHWHYWGAFIQDDFRITPTLTLNVGIRWDLYGFYSSQLNPQSKFCTTCINSLTGLPGEVQYDGNPGWPKGGDIYPANKNNFQPRFNFSWSPFSDRKTVVRGGYDVFTSNATNVGNFGVQVAPPGWQYYGYWKGSYSPNTCAAFDGACPPFDISDPTVNKATSAFPPINGQYPSQSQSQLLGGSVYYNAKPERDPFIQMWTLEIQRELPGSTMLNVGYIGSHGTHLASQYQNLSYVPTSDLLEYKNAINAVVPITSVYSGITATALQQVYGSSSLPRSLLLNNFPFYNAFQEAGYNGTSEYNALNVSIHKRLSKGFNFDAAYTFSKKITNLVTENLSTFVVDPIHGAFNPGGRSSYVIGGAGYQDLSNQNGRTIAADDVPHLFNVAATYELPFGKGKTLFTQGVGSAIFGGWRLSSTFNASSGIPLQVQGPCDAIQSAEGSGYCAPNLIGNPSNVPGGQNAQHWINAAAFQPAVGGDQNFWLNYNTDDPRAWQFGNAGPRLPGLRSPAFWNMDSALTRQFVARERLNIIFRWEVYNVLNHQNLGMPNTSYCLPPAADGTVDIVHKAGCTFGQITNVQTDPRSMQFGFRFTF